MNKIVFFGTSSFAASILEYLIRHKISIVAIVTQPDRAQKRSSKLKPPPVKKIAQSVCAKIPIFQPEKASHLEFIQEIEKVQPDLFIVVAYGQILRKQLLDIPKFGAINVHASLLPKYRGAAPIQRCLMNGDKKTGISLMKMNEKMDAGEIIEQQECLIEENETFQKLEEKLLSLSAPLLIEVLRDYELGIPNSWPQEEGEVTFAPKIEKDERQINWTDPAEKIHNTIRAFSIIPGAWSYVKINEHVIKLKILFSKKEKRQGAPGSVLQKTPLVVACGKDAVHIQTLQAENKKIMDAKDWIRGLQKNNFTFT